MAARVRGPHFVTRALGDGSTAAIARDGGAALGNSLPVDLGDDTLVFDAGLTPVGGPS